MNAFPRNAVGDNFRVNRSVKNCAGVFHLLAQFHSVDQISVVRKGEGAFQIIQNERLCILYCSGTGGRVPDMADADIAGQLF